MPESHGGKGGRKIGRDAAKCKRYREIMKREKNKARRLLSHLRRHPSDQCALDMLETLVTFLTPGDERGSGCSWVRGTRRSEGWP